ncbi:hypothetical protein H8E50_11060 [bacterium]|nr:hypothetical protein [bacterium]
MRNKLYIVSVLATVLFFAVANFAEAFVPVRISIKYILDSDGNRPATGNLNTDAEVMSEFDWGNSILASNMSEFRLELVEFIDLTGVSHRYSHTASESNRNALRTAAIVNPTAYEWRTNAINIYINGGSGSAISQFPPTNDIILMNQNCANTPSCMLHEIGHSLNLYHTHSSNETCSDTIPDNQNWSKDSIAVNQYGVVFASLTSAQQDAVNLVFNNVMSYHTTEPQLRISDCQRGQVSTQAYVDKGWLLARTPVYVNRSYGGTFKFGTYIFPFRTIQEAINSGGLADKALVLEEGDYPVSTTEINQSNMEIVPRSGAVTIFKGQQLYELPTDLENSKNIKVRDAVKASRNEDKAARKALKNAEKEAKKLAKKEARTALKAEAKFRRDAHKANALTQLIEAEKQAEGREKDALLLELAQRHRSAGDCEKAIAYYIKVAEKTDQPGLRDWVQMFIKQCTEEIQKQNPVEEEQGL